MTTPTPQFALPKGRPPAVEAVIAGILVLSIHGFMGLPFMAPLGADLQNVYAFHNCAARANPYLASGWECGDVVGRDFTYPPFLYWMFAWVRLLTFEGAVFVWTALIAAGTFLSLLAYAPAVRWRGDGPLGLFTGLLLVGYPMLLALERGNNDVVVLAFWSGAVLAWNRGRPALSGLGVGLAAAAKVYPLVGAVPVAAGVLTCMVRRPASRRAGLRFALGGLIGGLAPTLLLFGQVRDWITLRLPAFAAQLPTPTVFSHSMAGTLAPWDPWPLQVTLILAWMLAAARVWQRDPTFVLAGALAASTSIAKVSYDYNLITALPLLVVQFQRATASGRWRPGVDVALICGLVAVAGHRLLFALDPDLVVGRVLLLWGWLVASAALAAWGSATGEAATTAGDASPVEGQPA